MKLNRKSVIIIIILAAAAALIIALAVFMPRIMRRNNEPANMTPNISVIRVNVGRELDGADLQEIETIVRGMVGDDFVSVERTEGFAPMFSMEERGFDAENMTEEEYARIRAELIGDRLVITCLILTPEKSFEIYEAVGEHLGFDFEGGRDLHNREISDIFRVGAD